MSQLSPSPAKASFAPSLLPWAAHVVGELCESRGVTAYLVGGAVRDAILGRPQRDVDVAVEADPLGLGRELAQALGGRYVLMDASRGIVRVVVPRADGTPVVDLSPVGGGIAENLRLRDFAIDAMAVPLGRAPEGESALPLMDPHGGRSDLEAGLIRALSPAVFRDDPARLLRGPRLAAQLGFAIEPGTAAAIRRHARFVDRVAPERVRDELMKLLAEPGAPASLRTLDDLGLLCRVMPELESARGVGQPPEHHWNVFDHCVETTGQVERVLNERLAGEGLVERSVPVFDGMAEYFARDAGDGHSRAVFLKLAGLLHDIGKPATRTVEDSGRIRFLGHHRTGAHMCAAIMARLRFSGKGTDMVSRMVEHHLRPSQMAPQGELPTPKAVYRYYRDLGDVAIDTIYLNLADYLAARGPALDQQAWAEHCRTVAHILLNAPSARSQVGARSTITGHDIMEALSLEPGRRVGELLEMVREAEAEGEVNTREEALTLVAKIIRAEGGGA